MSSVETSTLPAAMRSRARGTALQSYFFLGIIALAALIVFAGFAPTFYLRGIFHGPALSPLVELHGVVFSSWIGLLLTQSLLIRTGNVRLHRRLGIAGALLAVAMVVIGVWTALVAAAHGTIGSLVHAPALEFLIVPLGQVLIFGALTTAAILLRRHPDAHRRFMIVATIHLIPPALMRAAVNLLHTSSPVAALIVVAVLVGACIAYDAITRGRVHPVFAVVAPLTVLSFPLRIVASHTPAWHAIAAWLVRGVSA